MKELYTDVRRIEFTNIHRFDSGSVIHSLLSPLVSVLYTGGEKKF